MLFCSCEPTKVCTAPWQLRRHPSAEVLLFHSNRMNSAGLQKRLQCLAASGYWVSALLSWESMRFMCRRVEGTLLQALGYAARQCCGDSNPWSWGEDPWTLQLLTSILQPHWAVKTALSCYVWHYYRSCYFCSLDLRFCHITAWFVTWGDLQDYRK